ncbi:hypothetical protein [Mycolicibacterium sediminis]|uniref:Uncharacterized protein n=1 Tax=Mycolicibacterium sediminis TaxID=1286180 RepID=A0A7I7QZL7_9MYCO|nr:hypothetical protein [Mycolicibacterium sediminis]BBY31752.1 hypothetical protein MSEDJ_58480 [Mycolicibacterium sediminis]
MSTPVEAASRSRRTRVYVGVAAFVAVAAVLHLLVQLVVYPSAIYWLSYYVPTYEFGFVRRGLGGELVRLLPAGWYFPATYTMMWAPVVAWFVALGVLIRHVLGGRAPSQRRILLAITIPVLPFALSYALYSPRPELWAMTALVAYALHLTRARTDRPVLIASAVYGVLIAVLAFAHEGIPLQLGLGVAVAIVALAGWMTPLRQGLAAMLAVGPGLVSIAAIAVLGGSTTTGPLLCRSLPHRMLDDPYAASNTPAEHIAYLLGSRESLADYHDWMCRVAAPMVDSTVGDGLSLVASFGFGPLFASTLLGLVYLAVTLWAVQTFSGTPALDYLRDVRRRPLLPLLGLCLVVPLFVTGVDWTRWWVLITFDLVLPYVLYAVGRPAMDEPVPARTVRLFVVTVVVLAVLPTGAALHVGGPNFQ